VALKGETEPMPGLGRGRRILEERYELLERIGVGGMAEVWRALDSRLDREVAVKLLPATEAKEASRRHKIEREARALAATSHPNIVAVYDYGEAPAPDGAEGEVVPYLVMELVEGPDLHRYLEDKGPLPLGETTELVGGILAAVHRAHEAGVVHGDLKPANVFISPHGPKVGDFGVARILDEETGTTTVAATPTFAAPEILKGERATTASDVYSVACLAFQALTGRPPFEGANAWDVASKHMEAPVPKVRKLRSDVPADLDGAIQKGMEKNPKRRFPDAASFAAALASSVTKAADGVAVPGAAATAAMPVSPDAPPVGEPTQALTTPRPNAARIAVLGPFAGVWERLSRRTRGTVHRSPNRRVLLLLLIPLLLLVAWLAMREPGPEMRELPDVVGERYQDAAAELRLEGFKVDVSFRPVTDDTVGRVIETIPAAEEQVAAGSDVHMIAGALAPTPAPAVQPSADDGDEDGARGEREGGGKGNKRKND
jgi:hypothetical protein